MSNETHYPAYDFPKPAFVTLNPSDEISGMLERAAAAQKLPAHVQIALVAGYITAFEEFQKDMEHARN